MKITYRGRRVLALITLCIGLPVYVVIAVTVIDMFERLPMPLELALYTLLGIGWIFPVRWIFRGVGKADPDQTRE